MSIITVCLDAKTSLGGVQLVWPVRVAWTVVSSKKCCTIAQKEKHRIGKNNIHKRVIPLIGP